MNASSRTLSRLLTLVVAMVCVLDAPRTQAVASSLTGHAVVENTMFFEPNSKGLLCGERAS